ncbi:hypothetical protein AB5B87_001394 [Providencia rettgeri]|uniref:hypothetical protein n=1 Tax=Providencia rettgeri TaxID=587 RepID=UPI0028823280|nr:hypothetical protein [Providencia rettgeri]ELM3936163.1 hypothetical protein [Providencia rettgeri]EMA4643914.1 hypothetical protein [Providencia rettgeri]MDK3107688.1 hypothetical protein [Providencia rettgeri]WRR95380.1 hypothetical protein VNI59_11370 [Providencia rettgeri]
MIYDELQFKNACNSNLVKFGALPQENGNWCLARKVGSLTAYLGNPNTDSAREFSTLDELKEYAHNNQIGEILLITGATPWVF